MCTSPLLIRNKKYKSLKVDLPNTYIQVPCGSCDECLRKRAKDLFVRAKFEAERCILKGGTGFMCCLTYDNTNVPLLHHLGRSYMVFDKQGVIKFIKRLRSALDRFFQRHYGCNAPDFKYLITSEFGTDPTRTRRPHYHLLILFDKPISLFVFRLCFKSSLINRKTGKSYFGKVFQCDKLDIKRGGVRYTSKYILKDVTYTNQNNIIHEYIKHFTEFVNSKHGIIEIPKTAEDYFHNRCIRSSKKYLKDVADFVSPWRHKLQFYMCSNDFGCSAIFERYGESIYTLGLLNIDKCPYSIPKAFIQRLERTEGSESRDNLSKAIFLAQFKTCIDDCVSRNLITSAKGIQLYDFANDFLQPRFGSLYFISPVGYSYYDKVLGLKLRPLSAAIVEYELYDDNDFFALRSEVLSVIGLCNTPTLLDLRAKLAHDRSCKERSDYEKKKRNKPSNY